MDWIEIVARFLSFWLDKVVYGFIPTVYNILTDIAETTIFSEDIINLFASKIYALLGIFMLFKVSFSILTYIVDPDAFLDKSKGFSKLISNIIITLVLLVLTPWIFSQAMEIQSIVLRDNIIGSLFSVTGTDATSNGDPGNKMAYETFKAFYHIDTNLFPECESGESSALADPDGCVAELGLVGEDKADEGNQLKDTLNYAYNTNSVSIYMDYDLLNLKDTGDEFVFYYLPVVSTICGVVILLLLIVFCFDIAVRSIKLGFLNVIAPIPIISRIDPKKGKDTFDKWVKMCISTYLDLFIRLLAIYFAVFIISQVIDLQFVSLQTGTSKNVDMFVKVFIILGALIFAKQFPKLIEDITGIKMDGKFTLNPLKKFEDSVLGGQRLTGAAGGLMARGIPGMIGGFALGKGFGAGRDSQVARRHALQNARANGSTFFDRSIVGFQSALGRDTELDRLITEEKAIEEEQSQGRAEISANSKIADVVKKQEDRARERIKNGLAGELSQEYVSRQERINELRSRLEDTSKRLESTDLNDEQRALIQSRMDSLNQEIASTTIDNNRWLENDAINAYIDNSGQGQAYDDGTMRGLIEDYNTYSEVYGQVARTNAADRHAHSAANKARNSEIERSFADGNRRKEEIQNEKRRAQANVDAVKSGGKK